MLTDFDQRFGSQVEDRPNLVTGKHLLDQGTVAHIADQRVDPTFQIEGRKGRARLALPEQGEHTRAPFVER